MLLRCEGSEDLDAAYEVRIRPNLILGRFGGGCIEEGNNAPSV